MRVKEVMSHCAQVVSPEASLREAAGKMQSCAGFLPVVEDHSTVGILTDQDIARRAVAEYKNLDQTKVRDVMTGEPFYCFEDQEVKDVARIMSEKKVRRILVLNHEQRLAGVVSADDLSLP